MPVTKKGAKIKRAVTVSTVSATRLEIGDPVVHLSDGRNWPPFGLRRIKGVHRKGRGAVRTAG